MNTKKVLVITLLINGAFGLFSAVAAYIGTRAVLFAYLSIVAAAIVTFAFGMSRNWRFSTHVSLLLQLIQIMMLKTGTEILGLRVGISLGISFTTQFGEIVWNVVATLLAILLVLELWRQGAAGHRIIDDT